MGVVDLRGKLLIFFLLRGLHEYEECELAAPAENLQPGRELMGADGSPGVPQTPKAGPGDWGFGCGSKIG